MRAHIRHEHTNYDDLLGRGYDREDARGRVLAKLEATAEAWKKR